MTVIYIIATIALITAVILTLQPKKKYVVKYSFTKKEYCMTKSEQRFFTTLKSAVGDKYHIFPQIHLSSFVNHKIKGQSWRAAFTTINQKSVDYILVDKISFKTIAAIELDDPTHKWENRKKRDLKVENLLKEINLPLLRFSNYNAAKEEIIDKINYNLKRTDFELSTQREPKPSEQISDFPR